MADPSNENLYLLEFLVNDLKIDGGGKCTCQGSAGELCVSFQFLDNQELELCERDFAPDKKFSSDNSRIGKSCIFSLTPEQADKALQNFNIMVYITKKGGDAQNAIGAALVQITELLADLLKKADSGPVAKVLEDSYPVKNADGVEIGAIAVYIRLSCYGKMIITQFQMNMNDKSVLFKDKEGRSLYRYKKKKGNKTTKIEDAQPENKDEGSKSASPQNPNCPSQPCYPNGPPPNSNGSPFCATDVPPPASEGQSPWGYQNYPSQPSYSTGPPPNFTAPPFSGSPFYGTDVPPPSGEGQPPWEYSSFDQFRNPGCPSQPCFPNGIPPGFSGMPPCYSNAPPFQSGFPSAPPTTPDFGSPPFEPDYVVGGPPDYLVGGQSNPTQPPAEDFNMFYPPTMAQQASTFPIGTYEQQMAPKMTRFSIGTADAGTRPRSCLGPCARK